MKHSDDLICECRRRRGNGESIIRIATDLDIAKSTVSRWVRDVILSEDDLEKLRWRSGRKIGEISKIRKRLGEEEWEKRQRQKAKDKSRKFRQLNPNYYNEQRNALKRQVVEYKGGRCERCGYSKCLDALSLHHRDPSQKEFTISRTRAKFEKIKDEIDKCRLLCSNCHAEVHCEMKACKA